MTEDWAPSGVDTSKPSAARMYDYFLGGKDNYRVDREAAETVVASAPEVQARARENRAFLQRAVRFLAEERGIRQFIDIGSGLPTEGNVHEVAREVSPDARVAYVDNDPIVLAHNRELLSGVDGATTISADMCRPDTVLTHPTVNALVDFDAPLAVLFVSVLHFVVEEEDPYRIVGRFRGAMVPGSYLVLSHACARDRQAAEEAARAWDRSTASMTLRTHEQIRAFFDGFEVLEPGVVNVAEWRSDAPESVEAPKVGSLVGGVGRKH